MAGKRKNRKADRSISIMTGGDPLKKPTFVLPFLPFLCYGTLPLFSVVGWIFGYHFVLCSYSAYSVVLAIMSFLSLVFLMLSKVHLTKTGMVFSALLLPMSAVSGICCLSHSGAKSAAVFTFTGCCCAIAVFDQFAGPRAFKIVSGIFSVLLFISMILVSVAGVFRSSNTVIKSVSSPHDKYVAEMIDDNQGALGGNTLVEVKDNSQTIDLYIGRFLKPPVRVYTGKWGEFTNMQINWKNEDVLVINGREYRIGD